MLVSCMMLTYNRFTHPIHLVDEALASFLLQDYLDKELLICNDTPGQAIVFKHPRVKIFNL